MMPRLVDLDVYKVHATDRAILVSTEGPGDTDPIWVPLAICEFSPTSKGWGTLSIEEHHAKEKGLI